MYKKGFTLIELLVVISIIGMLSAIVLTSVNSARAKGADASIKTNLYNARTQAEVLYDDNNPDSYATVCTQANIAQQVGAAMSASGITAALNVALGTAGTDTTATCHVLVNNSAYAIEVPLKTVPTNGWCVDSTGASMQVATHLAANDVTCN